MAPAAPQGDVGRGGGVVRRFDPSSGVEPMGGGFRGLRRGPAVRDSTHGYPDVRPAFAGRAGAPEVGESRSGLIRMNAPWNSMPVA